MQITFPFGSAPNGQDAHLYLIANTSGAMVTGWLQLGGVWYYMNPSGAMVIGRQQINGTWYTFSSSGALL